MQSVALRRIVRIINGGTPTPEPENWNGEVPWATPVDLGRANGFSLIETGRNLTTKGALSGSTVAPKGSVLLSTRAPIGYVAINEVPMAFNQGCKALIPVNGVSAPFLRYALTHIEPQLQSMGQGSTFLELSASALASAEIPLPTTDVQIRTVDFLHRETTQIDELIGKQERLIEILTEKRQAIITHAVTKGLDPNAPTKPSGVPWQGPVPEHWTVQPLKNLIRMQTGVTLGKDFSEMETETYPYLRVANVQIGYVDLNEVKEIDLPKEVAATSMLRAGDVLMTEGGDRDKLARGCIWEAPIAPCVHQNHIFAVRTGNHLLNEFLVLVLDADPARSYFYLTGKQSTNLASTNSTTVKNYRFGVPPMDEQQRIVDHLGRKTRLIDDLVDKANAVISMLKERRSALISAAVTGKIEVQGAA